MESGSHSLRTDIQALRGIAVLLVILQHARADFIGAGFLGVDIFFVISGFLITGMLARNIRRGTFRFSTFYFRRAKRLLPAAYVTFALTAAACYIVLDATEWRDFTQQLVGAVTFTGNFVLWHQTGYFSDAAALKPLLHVWSLAVEEQYYLLLPATLFLVPRRWWFAGSLVVLVSSFGLCAWLTFRQPEAAFYLLPTRAWELAIGSIAALMGQPSPRLRAWIRRLFAPALIVLLAIPTWPLPTPAFVNIALVCIATLLIILRDHPEFHDRPIPNALASVGNASYSLYLVHWPIFALIDNVYAGDPSFGSPSALVLGAGVALSLVLGFALSRWIEIPLHRYEPRTHKPWAALALAISLCLALIPTAITAHSRTHATHGPKIDYAWLLRDNLGFDKVCDGYKRLEYTMRCSNSRHPRTMVWGDSFAMHLVPGLAETMPGGILQATKSACGPLLGLAQIYGDYTRPSAERCLSFNNSVIAYLADHPGIRTVVLSSPFYEYFDPERRMLHVVDGQEVVVKPEYDLARQALLDTIGRIRALGRQVVIVAPPPSDGFDYTHCQERKARDRTLLGRFIDCNIPLTDYHASKRHVLDFLHDIHARAHVGVIWFDRLLCHARSCVTELDGTILYRDDGHLSYAGSRLLARRMHLARHIEALAGQAGDKPLPQRAE